MSETRVEQAWWWPGGRADGQRPMLFFPPSGAEPTSARSLFEHSAGLRFGVAQLPGRGSRLDEPAPTDLRELVDDIAGSVRRLDGPPPVLVGHSFGGLLAYGVVAALEAAGAPVGRLIVVASTAPASWADELAADRLRHPDDDRAAFVRRRTDRILAYGGVPDELLSHREFADRARELVAVDVALSHAGFPIAPIRTPITAVIARDDTVLGPTAADRWSDVSTGAYLRIDVPGNHFFYRSDPRRLMAQLRMELQSLDGDYELL